MSNSFNVGDADDVDLTMSDHSNDDDNEFVLAPGGGHQHRAQHQRAGGGNNSRENSRRGASASGQQPQTQQTLAQAFGVGANGNATSVTAATGAGNRNLRDELGLPPPPRSLAPRKSLGTIGSGAAAADNQQTQQPAAPEIVVTAPRTATQTQNPRPAASSSSAAVAAANVAINAAVSANAGRYQKSTGQQAAAATPSRNNNAGTAASTPNTGRGTSAPSARTGSTTTRTTTTTGTTGTTTTNTSNTQQQQHGQQHRSNSRATTAGDESNLSDVPAGVDFLWRMGNLYQTYRDKLQKEKTLQDVRSLQKKPKITEYAQQMRHSEDVLQRLAVTSVNRMRLHQERRIKEREKSEQRAKEQETEECTFHPKIDDISKHKPRHGTVHESNQKWLEERERKLEFARKKKMEKEFLEQTPGPMLASAGKYSDPVAAEARRHGLPIEDHLMEMGRIREQRMFEKVQERLEGRSSSQGQYRSISQYNNNSNSNDRSGSVLLDGSNNHNHNSHNNARSRSEASIAESVVARLYTPNKRPAVYDEDYVQNCTFHPRVYSTFEDPLAHLPAHERLRMRGGSEQSIRRHQQVVMELDRDKTGHPRISDRSIELVARRRAEEEVRAAAAGIGDARNPNASNASGGGAAVITEMRSPSQRLYQEAFTRDRRLYELQREADLERRRLGRPVTNTPVKQAARKAGARPQSPSGAAAAATSRRSGSVASNRSQNNNNNADRSASAQSYQSSGNVYERIANWDKKRAAHQQQLQAERDREKAEENMNYSFQPKINTSCSVTVKQTREPVRSRCQYWAQRREERLKELAEQRKKQLAEEEEKKEREIEALRKYQFKAKPAPPPPGEDAIPDGFDKFVERQQRGIVMKHERDSQLMLRPEGSTMMSGKHQGGGSNNNNNNSSARINLSRPRLDNWDDDEYNQGGAADHDGQQQQQGRISHLISPRPFSPPGKRMNERIAARQEKRERIAAPSPHQQQQGNHRYFDPQGTVVTPHRFSYMGQLRRDMQGTATGTATVSPSPDNNNDHNQPPMPPGFGVVQQQSTQQQNQQQHGQGSRQPPPVQDEREFLARTHLGGLSRPMAPHLSPEARFRAGGSEFQDPHDRFAGGRTSLTPTRQDRTDRVYPGRSSADSSFATTTSSNPATARRLATTISTANNQQRRAPATARQQQQQPQYTSQDEVDGDLIQQRARALLNRSAQFANRRASSERSGSEQQQQHHQQQFSMSALPPPPIPPTAPILNKPH